MDRNIKLFVEQFLVLLVVDGTVMLCVVINKSYVVCTSICCVCMGNIDVGRWTLVNPRYKIKIIQLDRLYEW
jgi:hypothetical protein